MAVSDFKGILRQRLAIAQIFVDIEPLWAARRPLLPAGTGGDSQCVELVWNDLLQEEVALLTQRVLSGQIDQELAKTALANYQFAQEAAMAASGLQIWQRMVGPMYPSGS